MDDIVKNFQNQLPSMVKDNRGALIGAVIGYVLTDNKQAQSAILGAIAGSLIDDHKLKKALKEEFDVNDKE